MKIDYAKVKEQLGIRFGLLHEVAPDSIGDMLHMELEGYADHSEDFLMTCDTYPWMQNPIGLLHGGIISTILDQGMGMLAHCMIPEGGFAPSISLNVSYVRPMHTGKRVLLKIHVESATRTLIHMRAEAYEAERPEKLCVTGTGVYYYKSEK